MKLLFLVSILYLELFSYSLIDYYRKYGTENIGKEAERLLKSKQFWLERLKNIDTDFGYYEDIEYLLIVNKIFQSLDIYRKNGNIFQMVTTFDILVGEKRGDKFTEGDKRTPTGVYELVETLKKLDQFYGPLAFVTSYPNLFDKLHGKSGSGIWIHGYPLRGDRNPYTKGCIALKNDRLLELSRIVRNLDKTLLILEDGQLERVSKEDLATILASLYRWLDSWRSQNLQHYLSFYSKEFRRFDGNDLKWFREYKKKVFSKKKKTKIFFTNINITPYPNREKKRLFRITFQERYISGKYRFQGKKELYIELIGNRMKILVER